MLDWGGPLRSLEVVVIVGMAGFLHELGHFVAARCRGIRVITFGLGVGPRLWGIIHRGTRYELRFIPLGGYLRVAGEQPEQRTGAPDEFRSRTRWVRFQVYIAGPAMNLLVACLTLSGSMMLGEDLARFQVEPAVIGSIEKGSSSERAGLRVGDRVVAVNGRSVSTWSALEQMAYSEGGEILLTVERGANRVTRTVSVGIPSAPLDIVAGIGPAARPEVGRIVPGNSAERAGLHPGDVVVAIDGHSMDSSALIRHIRESAGKGVIFTIERHGTRLQLPIVPANRDGLGVIGAEIQPFEIGHVTPGLWQALVRGVKETWANSRIPIQSFRNLVGTERDTIQLVGPVRVATLTPPKRSDPGDLLRRTSFASVGLGVVSLLPLPWVDGGPILILAIEGIRRRALTDRSQERILMLCASLVLAVLVNAMADDVARIFRIPQSALLFQLIVLSLYRAELPSADSPP